MRKRFFCIPLLLAGCAGPQVISQPDTTIVQDAKFERIIESPGLSKKQIFDRSRQWMALTFTSAKKAIEYEDEAAGKIIGNGSMYASSTVVVRSSMLGDMPFTTPYSVNFSLVEDMKDGKARVTASNFQLISQYGAQPIHKDAWGQVQPKIVELCSGLESYLLHLKEESW